MIMMRFETLNAIAALNSSTIAADKLGSKRVYYCQRCLNHNRLEPRKNHKCECVYANCACHKCILVEKRRVLNTQLHELEEVVEADSYADIEDGFTIGTRSKGERVPNCQKCGQHGRKSRLKGHKRICPYRDCDCAKCQVVSERQKLMADQIKIRRRQRKDTLLNITRENITATLNAAAAVASSAAPLPYFPNINALIYKQLQHNMQNAIQPAAACNMSSAYDSCFDSYPNFLTSGDNRPLGLAAVAAAAAAVAANDNLSLAFSNNGGDNFGLQLGAQSQTQQTSPTLSHLQFLIQQQQQQQQQVPLLLGNNDRLSVTTIATSPSGTDEANTPPIAIPVPINPLMSAIGGRTLTPNTISAMANNTQQSMAVMDSNVIALAVAAAGNNNNNNNNNNNENNNNNDNIQQLNSLISNANNNTLASMHQAASLQNVICTTRHNNNNNNNNDNNNLHQVPSLSRSNSDENGTPLPLQPPYANSVSPTPELLALTSKIINSMTNTNISAFLDNEQLFQTLLTNMRLLEQKVLCTADSSASKKTDTEISASAFVDVCTM